MTKSLDNKVLIEKSERGKRNMYLEQRFSKLIEKLLTKGLGAENVRRTHGHRLMARNKRGDKVVIVVSATMSKFPEDASQVPAA